MHIYTEYYLYDTNIILKNEYFEYHKKIFN